MSLKTIWHIRYACGHEADRDLSAFRPSDRAGRARFYATGDCIDCWKENKRSEENKEWREKKRAERTAWERGAGMPILDGSERAVAWAGRVRHQLLTEAHDYAATVGVDDTTFVQSVEAPARLITSASWWIDQRDIDPADVPELIADAASNPLVNTCVDEAHR